MTGRDDLGAGAPRYTAIELARASGLPHPPTPEQVAVIEAPLRPMLVVAGAGSGKTETMAGRVVWLVANGFVAPEHILGLTFTRKAAAELAERVGLRLRRLADAGLLPPTLDEHGAQSLAGVPTVSTYHAYSGRLVSEHGLRLGIEPDTRLLTEAAAWQYAAEAVARYDGDMDEVPNAESTVIGAVVDLAGELAEHLLEVGDLRDEIDRIVAAIDAAPPARPGAALPADVLKLRATLRARREVLPIVSRFQQLKRSRDAMDFADQVALAARLATEIPEVGSIERRRFHAVLLDEFQDTSEAQLALLRGLFVAPGAPVRVTAVGDPHQAIYGWRGASATTLSRFPVEFADPAEAQVANLATTWRNDVRILDAANLISRPLREAAVVEVTALRARPSAPPGSIAAGRYETQAAEAVAVAHWLAQVCSPGVTTAAVLCRKRSQFAPIMAALEAHGIAFEVVGLGGLLLTPEVSDLVAVLRILSDPTRGDAVMRLVTGASCRLGAADLDGLHAWARERQHALSIRDREARDREGPPDADSPAALRDLAPDAADALSLAEAIDDLPLPDWVGRGRQRISGTALERLARVASALRALRSLRGMALVDMVGEAERALGLDIEVLARPDYTPSAARAHLDAFADVAASFSATADHPTLSAFLAWLDAAVEQERGLDLGHLEPARDAVQILTVHAAKGLEWDVVAIPGLVEGTFPAADSAKTSHVVKPSVGEEAPLDPETLTPDPEYRWQVNPPKASGWLTGLQGVPYALRGDADGLPDLRTTGLDGKELLRELADFKSREGVRELTEERRLAYVAVTRARSALLLTSHVWGTQVTPRVTSPFLREILAAATDLGVELRSWAPMPDPDAVPPVTNPTIGQAAAVLWPVDPFAMRRDALERAHAAVAEARATQLDVGIEPPALPLGTALLPARFDAVTGRDADAVDVALLIAERRAAAEPRRPAVALPGHVTASDVVRLAQDPAEFARELRRPMPQPPAWAARRGTEFHAWVEQHYARAALLDIVELPGAADDTADAEGVLPLARLQELFLASEWADRVPRHLEYAVETVVAGVAVRGRIDAVFDRADGGVTVVDWKTGPRPHGEVAHHRTLQLAAYALAFARLTGRDPQTVDAAFYYAQTGETVYPDVPDEQALRRLLGSIPVAE